MQGATGTIALVSALGVRLLLCLVVMQLHHVAAAS